MDINWPYDTIWTLPYYTFCTQITYFHNQPFLPINFFAKFKWTNENVRWNASKVKYHRKFFIETPKFVVRSEFQHRVVKKCSDCVQGLKVKCDRQFWKTLGPHKFVDDKSCDLMVMFTSACARTYDFSHLSRTTIRSSINVVRCVVKKCSVDVSPFLGAKGAASVA